MDKLFFTAVEAIRWVSEIEVRYETVRKNWRLARERDIILFCEGFRKEKKVKSGCQAKDRYLGKKE